MALLVLAGSGHPVLTRMSERRSPSCSISLEAPVLPHYVSILRYKVVIASQIKLSTHMVNLVVSQQVKEEEFLR